MREIQQVQNEQLFQLVKGSEGENFEFSESNAFLEVEIDGLDYLEDIPAEILPCMIEQWQWSLMSRPEASLEGLCKESPSEHESANQW